MELLPERPVTMGADITASVSKGRGTSRADFRNVGKSSTWPPAGSGTCEKYCHQNVTPAPQQWARAFHAPTYRRSTRWPTGCGASSWASGSPRTVVPGSIAPRSRSRAGVRPGGRPAPELFPRRVHQGRHRDEADSLGLEEGDRARHAGGGQAGAAYVLGGRVLVFEIVNEQD